MEIINVDGKGVRFDPYSEDPASEFERVTKRFFNILHDDINYKRYKELAGDRGVSAITKSDMKGFKEAVQSDVNNIFESRGIIRLEDLLKVADKIDLSVDWGKSKEASKKEYSLPGKPEEPVFKDIPEEPSKDDQRYQPEFGFLDYVLPYRKERKREQMREKFNQDHEQWEKEKAKLESENKKKREEYEKRVEQWESQVEEIREKKRKAVEEVEDLREAYQSGERGAVEEVMTEILGDIPYPFPGAFNKLQEVFDGEIELTFKAESNLLIVDRAVPPPEVIPRRKRIKYVKSRDAFKGKDLSKRDFNQLYESIPYQIALRTAYEVFNIDDEKVVPVDGVVFNGWVTSVNPATGHEETVCTLSLQVSRDEIMEINLSKVDPEAAFKNLKGVSASKLRDKSPVTPIVQVDRSDNRFIEGRDAGEEMDEGENIAAMDWEDFEHLIRELFESEFAKEGGEVNVTQASRDGGIDAVAFDPDPLRGGKIVIQAKRYTRTVGVSAVRDLYGTVMNEGASRGILVTTSDYGSGAYDFAKDKPLQLLDGGNLLSLLEQHGYDARIDVEEARERMD